mmetsp:Transcript_24645/g.38315  ORF Transcript_24645/g.38315 Transcript_24645/m.38315 type:complete len:193 (+) Transcript_24645:282-860(+)|eukprot:CAMPEP_0170493224 /NCGR_PEP_ID=MMETSP0208-20121228/13546_1 /TAXON_ID=197538 /ORGANISM="Strombidium inclinatum, Strain S3" /LENGTH=192 /DNA_ID=CAMNT_0010769117 /DNA_START=251 /DNA_END=829 /DNA_ORIENTATION=+
MLDYVRYMEAQGARVVPIINGEDHESIREKLKHLDGVLLPGGDGHYYDTGKFVFDEVKKMNDDGLFFPLWGTCLGYEYLAAYSADQGQDIWGDYVIHDVSLTLDYTEPPMKTRMYGGMGMGALEYGSHNYTYNSHDLAVGPETYETDAGLKDFWDVTALSYLINGTAFVASIEAKDYPFFATQYHPERPSQL